MQGQESEGEGQQTGEDQGSENQGRLIVATSGEVSLSGRLSQVNVGLPPDIEIPENVFDESDEEDISGFDHSDEEEPSECILSLQNSSVGSVTTTETAMAAQVVINEDSEVARVEAQGPETTIINRSDTDVKSVVFNSPQGNLILRVELALLLLKVD